ncbi:MAG TPA: helix-turn-helix transcriptional regulator [Thermoanaerobaculia bacterium]|nr:helix-turn-helix transcriptional regulator [Thermoanaerobaculia bacterium]
MTLKHEAEASRLVVLFLRDFSGRTQAELGKAAQVDQTYISRFELGKQIPTEEVLQRMSEAAGAPWDAVVFLRHAFAAVLSAAERHRLASCLGTPELDRKVLELGLLAAAPYLMELALMEPEPPTPEEERCEADEVWTALERYPADRRPRLIELSLRASRSWALAERICEASAQAAEHRADEALELAYLALRIAGQVEGEDGWRSQVQGYAWAFVANARRAAQDPDGAGEAFKKAWELWRAGAGSAPGLLREERMLELEEALGDA